MNIMIKTTQGLCVEQQIIKQKQIHSVSKVKSFVCWSINSLVGGIL
jgi:hypothetical protein